MLDFLIQKLSILLEMLPSDTMVSIAAFLPKIFVSSLCGLIVGIEREYKNKPVGVRTMILICSGCTLLTAVSFHVSPDSDPSRIIAQIITGIGFLGGGVIMKTDDKILGVTTAAFIWVISAMGIMIGVGELIVPIVLTLGLVLLSLFITFVERTIKKLKKKFIKEQREIIKNKEELKELEIVNEN